MTVHIAKPEHEVAYQDLCKLIDKHASKLTALELLAVAANMLGKLVALQDQRKTTPEMAMKVVSINMEHGNQTIVAQLAGPTKGTA